MYKCSRYICWLPKEPMFGVTEADMGGHRRVFKRTVIYTDVSTREIQSHVIVQALRVGTCTGMTRRFYGCSICATTIIWDGVKDGGRYKTRTAYARP